MVLVVLTQRLSHLYIHLFLPCNFEILKRYPARVCMEISSRLFDRHSHVTLIAILFVFSLPRLSLLLRRLLLLLPLSPAVF